MVLLFQRNLKAERSKRKGKNKKIEITEKTQNQEKKKINCLTGNRCWDGVMDNDLG